MPLMRYALRHSKGHHELAESFLSDTAVKMLMRLNANDAGISNLPAFTYTCLRHVAVDHWRKSQRQGPHVSVDEIEAISGTASQEVPFDQQLISREDLSLALLYIAELPASHRLVAEARFFDGSSYNTIARAMNISPALARKRVQQVRGQLRGVISRPLSADVVRKSNNYSSCPFTSNDQQRLPLRNSLTAKGLCNEQ